MEELLKILSTNPEVVVPTLKVYIEKYKPVVYGILKELMAIYADYANNKEFPALKAKERKTYYDALIAEGFTRDQAMAIMINDNIRLMDNMTKISSSTNKVSVNKE